MLDCHGCATFVRNWESVFISGHSKAGKSQRVDRLLWRSIRRCGAEASRARTEPQTSTTRTPLRNGCAGRITMVASQDSSIHHLLRRSARWPKSRVGFWESSDLRFIHEEGDRWPGKPSATPEASCMN